MVSTMSDGWKFEQVSTTVLSPFGNESLAKCKFSADPDWFSLPVRQRGPHGVPVRRIEGVS